MGDRLNVDPEFLYKEAEDFKLSSDQASSLLAALNGHLENTENLWPGESGKQFEEQFLKTTQNLTSGLKNVTTLLKEIGAALQHQAASYQVADDAAKSK